MRKLLYIVLVGAVFFAPVSRLDIAKLEPIEAVAVEISGDRIVLKTDSGRQGRGQTVSDALRDLKQNTPAVVYLDTARYLLLSPGARSLEAEIREFLRSNITVAPYSGGDVKAELDYLQAHLERARPLPQKTS